MQRRTGSMCLRWAQAASKFWWQRRNNHALAVPPCAARPLNRHQSLLLAGTYNAFLLRALLGTRSQAFDEPAARGSGRFRGEINGRHRQDQTLLRQIFDRQLDEAAFLQI